MQRNRRDFLKNAAAITASAATFVTTAVSPDSASASTVAAGSTLPSIKLGPHDVTRVIGGSNPQNGYSHFNALYDRHMREYHTPDRVVEYLKSLEANGINTWQAGFSDRLNSDFQLFRDSGGKLQLIVLSRPDWVDKPEALKAATVHKPIAIMQHGSATETLFRSGQFQKSRDFLKRIRDTGALAGISTHDPRIIEKVESENWDVDLFMVCFYYVIRPREEVRQMLGDVPLGECFIESDPGRATAAIRQSKKPCLGFKIFAAGRNSDTPEQRRTAMQYAFTNIKPGDGVILGMYNRFNEQVADNAAVARQLLHV